MLFHSTFYKQTVVLSNLTPFRLSLQGVVVYFSNNPVTTDRHFVSFVWSSDDNDDDRIKVSSRRIHKPLTMTKRRVNVCSYGAV